jgi:hypothetical protein
MFSLKNEEILTYFLLIIVGYFIAKIFSKSCNGFSVGAKMVWDPHIQNWRPQNEHELHEDERLARYRSGEMSEEEFCADFNTYEVEDERVRPIACFGTRNDTTTPNCVWNNRVGGCHTLDGWRRINAGASCIPNEKHSNYTPETRDYCIEQGLLGKCKPGENGRCRPGCEPIAEVAPTLVAGLQVYCANQGAADMEYCIDRCQRVSASSSD